MKKEELKKRLEEVGDAVITRIYSSEKKQSKRK